MSQSMIDGLLGWEWDASAGRWCIRWMNTALEAKEPADAR